MATSNPSREAILARIRDGLRTPAPPIEDKTFYGPIFEAVENPLERFQQECKANLMECLLTADATASAQALAQVLQSLPPGEIFVQDDPVLRQLITAVRFRAASSLVERRRAAGTIASHRHAGRCADRADWIDLCERFGRRTRSIRGGAYSYRLCIRKTACPRPGNGIAQCHGGRSAGKEFLCLRDQRLQPHGRHRKDPGPGRTRADAAGGDRGEQHLAPPRVTHK